MRSWRATRACPARFDLLADPAQDVGDACLLRQGSPSCPDDQGAQQVGRDLFLGARRKLGETVRLLVESLLDRKAPRRGRKRRPRVETLLQFDAFLTGNTRDRSAMEDRALFSDLAPHAGHGRPTGRDTHFGAQPVRRPAALSTGRSERLPSARRAPARRTTVAPRSSFTTVKAVGDVCGPWPPSAAACRPTQNGASPLAGSGSPA